VPTQFEVEMKTGWEPWEDRWLVLPFPMPFPGEFAGGLGSVGREEMADGLTGMSPSTMRALRRYSMLRLAAGEKASGLSRVATPAGGVVCRVSRLIPLASETLGLWDELPSWALCWTSGLFASALPGVCASDAMRVLDAFPESSASRSL
jgi:hypothetical protein